jgi:large subunit ribosomal protein L9
MKVVLRNDVKSVGNKGDILDVADGYARNYLLPRGLAFLATDGALDQAERMRWARAKKNSSDRASALLLASQLGNATIKISARAGAEGKLYGSVTPADVIAAIHTQTGIDLDKHHVHLHDHIRTVGTYSVNAKLHPEVDVAITLVVEAG